MTSSLALLTVRIAQIHDSKAREVERSALEIGAKKERSYIIVQKKKDFLFCFVFPSHFLLRTEKTLLESWMEKLQHHSSLGGLEMY